MNTGFLASVYCAIGLLCSEPPAEPPMACERELAPAGEGLCNFQSDTGSGLLIQGDVVLPDGLLVKGEVLIDDGTVVCTSCDCSAESAAQDAQILSCPEAVISPGLINGRVSSTFGTAHPYTINETYTHRHGWRTGKFGETALPLNRPSNNSTDNIKWHEIRAVMAGTTSAVSSGGTDGMMRNLDRSTQNGFNDARIDIETFPLGDSNGTTRLNDCSYPDLPTDQEVQAVDAYIMSLAQGTRAEARNEFLCLSGQQTGSNSALRAPAAIVGGSALTQQDVIATVNVGTRLLWTPRSSTALYQTTPRVPEWKAAGGQIGLATDFIASGSANMLRELSCAERWNDSWGGDVFTDLELIDLATKNVAEIAGFGAELGTIEEGKEADLTVWDASGAGRSGFNTILKAENIDVALVMRAGIPLYGNQALMNALVPSDACETVDVCGVSKRLCAEREFGETLTTIADRVTGAYPLFSCDAWTNEPSCSIE